LSSAIEYLALHVGQVIFTFDLPIQSSTHAPPEQSVGKQWLAITRRYAR